MDNLGKILPVEDDPNGVDLTLMAPAENRLANEVVARDGEEAPNYLFYRRGSYETREAGNPAVILLDPKPPKVNGLEVLERSKERQRDRDREPAQRRGPEPGRTGG